MLHIYGDGRGLTVYLVPITLPGSSSLDTWLGRAGRVRGDGRKRIPTPPSGVRCGPLSRSYGSSPSSAILWDHGQVSASVSPCVELLSYTTHCHTLRRVPGTQEMLHKFYYLRGAQYLPKRET